MSLYHHDAHLVCTTCFRLRSIDSDTDSPPDRCRCQPELVNHRFGRELLMPCTLCATCGLAVAGGHTRWRGLHCDTCRGRVQAFNAPYGVAVVPVGIHSIVNGVALSGTDAQSPEHVEAFTVAMVSMFDRISALCDHVDQLVAERLRAIGLDQADTVPLEAYVDACREASIGVDDGWEQLMSFVSEQVLR